MLSSLYNNGQACNVLGLAPVVRAHVNTLALLDAIDLWNTATKENAGFLSTIVREEIEADNWIDTQLFQDKIAAHDLASSNNNGQACFVLEQSLGRAAIVKLADVLLTKFGKQRVTWDAVRATAARLLTKYNTKNSALGSPEVLAATTSADVRQMLQAEFKRS